MLQLKNVSYAYPPSPASRPDAALASPPSPPALSNISLTLPKGSFHLLTGPSGAGKTTLFKLLTLSLLPTEGTLELDGMNIATATRTQRAMLRRKLGVVYQDFRLLPHLTVRQNVELPLHLHNTYNAETQQAVADMLEWVGLTNLAHKPAAELSGGEQQRTAMARAVVHRPELIVADEPTGNVDATMARKILHLLTELHRHGTTVVVATHDANLLKGQPFPVLHLNEGKLETPDA
jgi:cell division transport system ATP-binding protein